ncbi:MAG: hypothetical protein HOP04_04060 [Methylophilaceae bacterium]|nr:hypothetical protein [Methylophilaceae bacterium]
MSEIGKSEAANLTASAFGVGRLRPGTVQVTVGSRISPKNLHDIIDSIINLHGCLACGLGGLDVLLRPQDPRILEGFQNIPEVKDVVIIR